MPEMGQNQLLTMEINVVVTEYVGMASAVAPTTYFIRKVYGGVILAPPFLLYRSVPTPIVNVGERVTNG